MGGLSRSCPFEGNEEPFSDAVAAAERLRKPRSGERPAGLRTTRAELSEAKTAPGIRQGLVGRRKQTAKCGVPPVKFGGDSGAVRQVSDIGGGFGRLSFTVWSRRCHGIRVKREIIIGAASLRTKGGGESFVRARRFLDPRFGYISAPNARLSHLRGGLPQLPAWIGGAASRV